MLSLGVLRAEAQHYDRGYETKSSSPFLEKGMKMIGGTFKYSQHINKNYNLLLLNNINSTGFDISVNPKMLYMFRNNMGIGFEVAYDRGMLDVISADMSMSAISMKAEYCYQINHKYSAHGVCRAYIPFADAKRIAMFADLLFGGSFKQGKSFNESGDYADGSYVTAMALEMAVDPGIIVFLTERFAFEMSMGIFGVSYSWNKQIHNQIDDGSSRLLSTGFMVNLLSLGVGLSYYFH